MKTLNEVIEALNNCADVNANFEACECCEYRDIRDDGYDCGRLQMMEDALHYLEEYQRYQNTPSRNGHIALVDFEESQKNEPLTWDDLKAMEGKPVWVEDNIDEPEDTTKYWAIYRRIEKSQETEYALLSDFYYDKAQYGETWQAYRKEKRS